MKRRKFIKKATIASGAFMMPQIISAQTSETQIRNEVDELLLGVIDLHIHAAPDTKERIIDEPAFARDAKAIGYRAVMFKSSDFSCHDRAFLLREMVPDFEIFGSICMNNVYGDKVNVFAAEMAVKTTGNYCKCIWMPTRDAAYEYVLGNKKEKGIPVLDINGQVLPEVIRVMEICAEADIIFATGHSSPEQSLVLAKKAKEVGLKKFVVTHAVSGHWKMSHEQIEQVFDLGAFVEFCCNPLFWGEGTGIPFFPRMSNEEFNTYLKINPERSFIATDLGMVGMPHPINAMRECISQLIASGFSKDTIDLLVRKNPAYLVSLDV